ncbi:hypothetical protein JCM3765_004018 [Sporobolomyces pararoseus]
MAATAVHQARSFESTGPPRLPSEDLLSETLVTPQDQLEQERDYTDDLEDLVRMQVTQQLHSRRSHQTIDFSSYPSDPPLSPTTALSYSSSPSQNHRSLIPRLQPTTNSRSPSPEVAREKDRSGSISSSRSLSRIPVGIAPSSTGMLRGNSNTSNTSNLSSTCEEENDRSEGREEERWETLQVGADSNSHPFPQPIRGGSTTPNRNGRAGQQQPRPSDPTRKRAQTNNLNKSSRALNPSTPQSSRKPYSNRTNYTPSPSSTTTTARTKKPSSTATGTPPIRRKSMSASTSTPREFSSYDLSSLPPEAFSPSPTTSNLPPPIPSPLSLSESLKISSETSPNSVKPLIYKNSKGELTDTGREEDRIIPTIAKKLEAERLRKLMEKGELVQGLVDEWGVDGTPQKQRIIEEKRIRGIGEVDAEAGEGARVEGEKDSSNEKPLPPTDASRAGERPQQLSTIEKVSGQPAQQTEKSSTAPSDRRTEVPSADRDAAKAGCCSCVIC